jgi:integrating conjugative element protein (TIGR03761 family)
MIEKRNNPLALQLYSQRTIELLSDKRTTQDEQQHKIFGFRTFCTLARTVWRKAHEDDPYAELVLIEIERRIQNCCEVLAQCNRDLDSVLNQHTGNRLLLSLVHAYSSSSQLTNSGFTKEPTLVHPNTDLPHANMGGALLALYDLLIRKAFIYRHFGIITGKVFYKFLKDGRASLRGVFAAPCMYKDFGVTRDDIINQTVEGIAAVEANGPIPEAVLNRSLLSKLRSGTYTPRPSTPGSTSSQENV